MRREMDNDTLLASNQQAGYLFALAEIQDFLNSLQEETPKFNVDKLREAAKTATPRERPTPEDKEKYMEALHEYAEKKREAPTDLEEAAKEYTQRMLESWKFDSTGLRSIREPFIAGAEWQEKQDEVEKNLKYLYGMDEGARIMKEQMMKDAVEGEVVSALENVNYVRTMSKVPSWLHFGQKVKLIIVKED